MKKNMNTSIGAFEAKTHFSALLNRIEHGEEIIITKHGKAIARLTPIITENSQKTLNAVHKIKSLQGMISSQADFKEWQNYF